MKTLIPGLIAGGILGLVMWVATGTFWFFPAGLALGLLASPLARREDKKYKARKKRDTNFRD